MTIKRHYGWSGTRPSNWTQPRYAAMAPVKVNHVDRLSIARPIRDQGQEGACTGFGSTGCVETVLGLSYPLSAQMAYFNARVPEASQNQDAGASVGDAVAGIVKYGCATEAIYPYVATLGYAVRPTVDAYVSGMDLKPKIKGVQQINGLSDLKHALANRLPVVFGFAVPDYFESDEVANTGWVRLPTARDQFLGGHCVFADGFDDRVAEPFIWAANSWSPDWGLQGWFKLDQKWFTDPRRLVDDAWVFIPAGSKP